MSDAIIVEGSGFGGAVAEMIATELAADIRKNGIAFTRKVFPERRDLVTKGAVSQLARTIVGSGMGNRIDAETG